MDWIALILLRGIYTGHTAQTWLWISLRGVLTVILGPPLISVSIFFFRCIRRAAKLPLELLRRAYPSENITYLGHLPSLRRAIVRINNVHRFILTMFSFLLFWTSRSALLKHQGNWYDPQVLISWLPKRLRILDTSYWMWASSGRVKRRRGPTWLIYVSHLILVIYGRPYMRKLELLEFTWPPRMFVSVHLPRPF